MEPNRTALIVDDEPLDLEFLRDVLEDAGFSVLSAGNYDEGVRTFDAAREEIDLLIVDVSLPGKNGIELARHLWQIKPGLKLLFASGHVGAEVIRFYGMHTGDQHFLQKPFSRQELVGRVSEILESPQPSPWTETAGTEEKPEARNRN